MRLMVKHCLPYLAMFIIASAIADDEFRLLFFAEAIIKLAIPNSMRCIRSVGGPRVSSVRAIAQSELFSRNMLKLTKNPHLADSDNLAGKLKGLIFGRLALIFLLLLASWWWNTSYLELKEAHFPGGLFLIFGRDPGGA